MRSAWTFGCAADADFDTLMGWFTTAADVQRWGGPDFRHPFTAESFRRDCHWPEMASYSLRDVNGMLQAFGQFYARDGHINLARIAVHPASRGQGIGRELVRRLMAAGRAALALQSWSLYVDRDNIAAIRCYRSLGFEIRPDPPGQKLAEVCFFMTRPADTAS